MPRDRSWKSRLDEAKRQRPRSPGVGNWILITEPDLPHIEVTTGVWSDAVRFADAFLRTAIAEGLSIEPGSVMSGTWNGERGLRLVLRGREHSFKVAEGYRRGSSYPRQGSGVLRCQIGHFKRWEPGPRKGSLIDQSGVQQSGVRRI